jgi:hypothetical protein
MSETGVARRHPIGTMRTATRGGNLARMARTTQPDEFRYRDHAADHAAWLAVMAGGLFLASLITGAWAIAALAHAGFLHYNELPFGDNVAWGIFLLFIATLQGVTSLLVLFGRPSGTYLGIGVAAINLLSHVGAIEAYPAWSGIAIIVNLAIIGILWAWGPRHR